MANQIIYPPMAGSLAKLAEIQGDDRCVLTVYFPGSQTTGAEAAQKLSALPGELIDAKGLAGDEAEHFRRCVELWGKVVAKVDFPEAVGWVAVISWLTEEVALMQLPVAVETAAFLDNSPFLLPAARLLDDYEAYAVVYADHGRAAIYLAALGKMAEAGRLRGDIKNHVRKGGWSQQRYERRRDKEIHYYCQAIIAKLTELVAAEHLRRIILAGDKLLINELEKEMTQGMQKQVVCRIPMEGKKQPHEVFRETLPAAAEAEHKEEQWLGNAIRSEHAKGGKAVIGPHDTLVALKEKRVRRLLIGPMENTDFWRCGQCGAFGLGKPGACPKCTAETYAQSAANEFTDLAFEGATQVELTTDPLKDFNGVAALLRW